jgi:hypothetical protein
VRKSDQSKSRNRRLPSRQLAKSLIVSQVRPGNALLLPARGTASHDLMAVECDPQIITLSGAATSLLPPDDPGNMRPVADRNGPLHKQARLTSGISGAGH